ncbi:MAG: hypothetical protein U0L88_04245, partial [Acutalibacteraceae bacterium]|nr:hypothetical protein [Acutalibacteraceae bacterium]
MAKTESVAIQMADILDGVSKDVKGVYETDSLKVAKETVQKLKNTSPKGSPHKRKYAEGWKVSKKDRGDLVVHNATNYQLTHLLENGHVIKNKKGTYGRTHG